MTADKPPETGTARAETEDAATARAVKVCVNFMMA